MQIQDTLVISTNTTDHETTIQFLPHEKVKTEKHFGKKMINPDTSHLKCETLSSPRQNKYRSRILKGSWVLTYFETGQMIIHDIKNRSSRFFIPAIESAMTMEQWTHSSPWVPSVHTGKNTYIRILNFNEIRNVVVAKQFLWEGAPIIGLTLSGSILSVISTEGIQTFLLQPSETSHFEIVNMGFIPALTSVGKKAIYNNCSDVLLLVIQNVIQLYDLKRKVLLYSTESKDNAYFLNCFMTEDFLFCATSTSLYIIYLDGKSIKSEVIVPLTSPVSFFKVFRQHLLTGSFDGVVRMYDLETMGTHMYDLNVGVECNPFMTSNMVSSLLIMDEYVIIASKNGLCEIYSLHMKYQQNPLATFNLSGDYAIDISQDLGQVYFLTRNENKKLDGFFSWKPTIEKLEQYMNQTILSEYIAKPKPGKKGVFQEWKSHNQPGNNELFIMMIQQLAEKEYPFLMNWHHSCTITNNTLPDNPIVFVSEGFAKMTGYTREEICGQNCRFLQGKYTDSETVKRVSDHLKKGKSVSVQILNYRKDGHPFWNVFVILPIHDAKGKVPAFIAIQKNITKIKLSQPLADWIWVHTSLWLELIGKSIYSQIFIHNKIDGRRLVNMTADELVSLGTSRDDATYIVQEIHSLVQRENKVLTRTVKTRSLDSLGITQSSDKVATLPSSKSMDHF